jgi:N-glycosylase/DNA lyase
MISIEYEKRKNVLKNRLEAFSKVKEGDYFYELCFCLLTPGSKARQAEKVVDFLKNNDFKNKTIDLKDELKKVRFYNQKRKRLLLMKENYSFILDKIKKEKNSFVLREFLVENVKGFGYKEASHFLRNIGRNNLAILDRHILKNMVKFGALDEIPTSLSSRKRYLEIEKKFRDLAKKNNISLDELDLLFWSLETGEFFK